MIGGRFYVIGKVYLQLSGISCNQVCYSHCPFYVFIVFALVGYGNIVVFISFTFPDADNLILGNTQPHGIKEGNYAPLAIYFDLNVFFNPVSPLAVIIDVAGIA